MWQAREKVQQHKHKHDMLDVQSFIDLFTQTLPQLQLQMSGLILLISQSNKNKQYGYEAAEITHLNGNPAGIDGVLSKWPKTWKIYT